MKATFAMAALYHAVRAAASVGVVLGCACASGHVGPPGDGGGSGGPGDAGTQPGWVVASREDFQQTSIPDAAWERDPVPDDGPFADDGAFFRARGVVPPVAYRTSAPLGADGWLRIESYTRSASRAFHDLAQVTADPAVPDDGEHETEVDVGSCDAVTCTCATGPVGTAATVPPPAPALL